MPGPPGPPGPPGVSLMGPKGEPGMEFRTPFAGENNYYNRHGKLQINQLLNSF